MSTLLEVLRAAPGERVAVVDPGADRDGAVTYESLRQRVMDMAGSLAASGIGPGERVAIALPNGLPVLVAILAAAMAGTAAPLRHASLAVSVANVVDSYRLGPEDVSLCVMPLFHVHGLVASALATFASAGTVVVPPAFSPFSFWRLVRNHGVTWYSAVPTIHQLLLARLGADRPDGAEQL